MTIREWATSSLTENSLEPTPRRAGASLVCVLMGPCLWAAFPLHAQTWLVEPTANMELLYEDNIKLDADDPLDSFGTNVGAAVRAVRASESSSLGLVAGVSRQWYFDVDNLDNTTGLIGGEVRYSGDRSFFGLSTAFSTQSTLTSEESTTGLSDINARQYRLAINPTWTRFLTERAITQVSLSYQEVFYEDVGESSLFDYRSGTVAVDASYRLTPRGSIEARLGYGLYSVPDEDSDTEAINAQLGADYQFSEALSVRLLIGLRTSETSGESSTGGGSSERATGPTYELAVDQGFARGGGLTLTGSRRLAPTGAAEVLDQTAVAVDVRYPLSERWTLGLGASGYRNRNPNDEQQSAGVDYAEGNLNVSFRLREDWRLRFRYRVRWQDDDQESKTAQANGLYLAVAWQGR